MTCEQLAAELRSSSGNTGSAPSESAPAYDPQTAPAAPSGGGAIASGRWASAPHQAYTNAAYVSADFHLDVTVTSSGAFRGSWARYVCAGAAYGGVLSCGKGSSEGSVSGQFDANGTGWIDLERVGRSNLTWSSTGAEVSITLPRDWQGENVLFRSKIKR